MWKQDFSTVDSWFRRLTGLWLHPWGHTRQSEEPLRLLSGPQPAFVRDCPLAQHTADYLRLLDWSCIPQDARHWFGHPPLATATYIAAFLVKLDQGLPTVAHLHRFLSQHPALVWGVGFPLVPGPANYGFDPLASLPVHRHFCWVLRTLPNELLQRLLDGQVAWLQSHLPGDFGQAVALDTKHILAWVQENNPKAYIKEGRFDKTHQPTGDPDCKLGCKWNDG